MAFSGKKVLDGITDLCLDSDMTTNTTTTAAAILEALGAMISDNRHAIDAIERFDADLALAAILRGDVEPDDNDGAITDPVEALVFGALMGDGPWWVA